MTPPPHVVQRKRSSPASRTAGTLASAGRNAANCSARPAAAPMGAFPAGNGPTRRPITRPHIRQRRSAWTQSLRPAMAICRFPFTAIATSTLPREGHPASCQYIRTGSPIWFPAIASQLGAMLRQMVRSSLSASPVAPANGRATLPAAEVHNPGQPLDLDWVHEARFTNRSATERRAATLPTRRSVKKAWQAAWLLRAITCIDLTSLQGDDTPGNVRRLCAKARHPVRRDILDALGAGHLPITVGAVCVYHNLVAPAVEALAGSGIPVAAVSTGFPAGQTPMSTKLAEIDESRRAG